MRHRQRLPELMDDPHLPAAAHAAALRGLARINSVSRSAALLWEALAPLARSCAPRRLRVLDLATGAGDVPLALAHYAAREGLRLELAACDVSPRASAHAQAAATARGLALRVFVCDVLREPLPTDYDVVISSLFLHHLDDVQARTLLASMRTAARAMVLVNDLRRSRAGWMAAWAGTRVLSRSHVVRIDGPRSVRAAFSLAELRALADTAGMTGAEVTPHWPWRLRLCWRLP